MPEVATMPRLDSQVCFAVYSTLHAINKIYAPLLDELGLTYPQYLAMLVLWETDGVTVKTLGERLHLDSGTLTPLLKRLEAQGRVHRARDPKDERHVRVSLTEAGHELRRRATEVPGLVARAMGRSADDLKSLRKELRKVRTALLESGHPSGTQPARQRKAAGR
jgi:DNA-binding MarR family transcriptional regulator